MREHVHAKQNKPQGGSRNEIALNRKMEHFTIIAPIIKEVETNGCCGLFITGCPKGMYNVYC